MASRSLIRQWHGVHGLLRKLAAPSMATNNLLKNTGSCRSFKYQPEEHIDEEEDVEEEWDAQKAMRDRREALALEGVQRDRDPYQSVSIEAPSEEYEFIGPCDMDTWYAWDFDPSAPRPNEHFNEECVLDLEEAGLLIPSNPEEPGPGLSLFTLLNCQRWIQKQKVASKRAARRQKFLEIPSVKKIVEGQLMDEFISACKDTKLDKALTKMPQPFRWNSLENIEKHKELVAQHAVILEDIEETPEEWQDLKPMLEWRIEYINLMLFEQDSWEDIQVNMHWIDLNGDLEMHEEIDEIQPGYNEMVVDYIGHLHLQDTIWFKRYNGFIHRENAERAAAILQRWRAGEFSPTSNVEQGETSNVEQGEKAKRSFGLPALMGYGVLTVVLFYGGSLWNAPPAEAEAAAAEGVGE